MERRRNLYLTKHFCKHCNLYIFENDIPPNPNSFCHICRRHLTAFDTDGYIFKACKNTFIIVFNLRNLEYVIFISNPFVFQIFTESLH